MATRAVLRPRETEDYPGLVVCDDRVCGSITAGRSRLPLWAMTGDLGHGTWEEMEADRCSLYGLTKRGFYGFIHNLLDHRREFGRLLCVLADVERRETERVERRGSVSWEERPSDRRRVRKALLACLARLDELEGKVPDGQ